MATRLFVRLARSAIEPDSACEWVLRGSRGALIRSGCDSFKTLPLADQTIGVLAPDVLLMRTVALPPGSRARTQAAMAHALEPFMLSDPTSNHVIALETAKSGSTVLVAIARQWLQTCMDLLAHAGHDPTRLIVESSLVNSKPGVWNVVHDRGGGFVVTDDRQIAALDSVPGYGPPVGLQWLANEAIESKKSPDCVRVYTLNSTSVDTRAWSKEMGLRVELAGIWDWKTHTDPASGFTLNSQANVLTGWTGNRRATLKRFGAWRTTALLGALIAAVHIGSTIVHWITQSAELRTIQADIRTIYHKSAPENEPLVDPVLQTYRSLSVARRATGKYSTDDFVVLLGRLSIESSGTPLGRLQSLGYRRGTITAEYRGTQATIIERVAEKLRAHGLFVELATTSNSSSDHRLIIRAEP